MLSRTRELLHLLAVVNTRLSEDVSLGTLAGWAHRSRFDLHRRLRQLTGETPKAYAMRVRLVRAAGELVASGRPVSVIAARQGSVAMRCSPGPSRATLGVARGVTGCGGCMWMFRVRLLRTPWRPARRRRVLAFTA